MQSNITPCLWFDDQGEQAAQFYCAIFRNSRIISVARYPEAGQEIHGKKAGAVMTVEFELNGRRFTALNGGPHFKFNEAISFQVMCDTQEEIDYYWQALSEGGSESQCGWLKDRFGLSWQIVPTMMADLYTALDPAKAQRTMSAMLQMKKLDIEKLRRAAAG